MWGPATAFGLILLGMGGGLVLLVIFGGRRARVVRPFLGGEIGIGQDRFRARGTGFYETIKRLPGLSGLLMHGENGAMDLYRWAGRYGGALVGVLKRAHSGLISLYVAWVIVGIASVLIYLFIAGYAKP